MYLNEYEAKACTSLSNIIVDAYLHGYDVDMVSLISMNCGWLPLELDESMFVSFGDKRYGITRTK